MSESIPVEAKTGLVARANDPRDRKIPMTFPFWSAPPYTDIRVVRQGTTVAEAGVYYKWHSVMEINRTLKIF